MRKLVLIVFLVNSFFPVFCQPAIICPEIWHKEDTPQHAADQWLDGSGNGQHAGGYPDSALLYCNRYISFNGQTTPLTLSLSSFPIDICLGVSHYDPAGKSGTYLFERKQLTTKNNTIKYELIMRHGDRIAHKKRRHPVIFPYEGVFNKVVRHESVPKNCWWKLIDKKSTRYFSGTDIKHAK